MLEALDHPQDTIHIKTDNPTAELFSNSTLKEKRSKSWGMKWWWIQDKVKLIEFKVEWDRGVNKYAGYQTKTFSTFLSYKN